MENSYSPLLQLADVACFVRQKEILLSEICVQKQFGKPSTITKTELGVVNGAPLALHVRSSSGNEFRKSSEFVHRKKENPINNVDYEVSMKRKLCSDFEAENPKKKK